MSAHHPGPYPTQPFAGPRGSPVDPEAPTHVGERRTDGGRRAARGRRVSEPRPQVQRHAPRQARLKVSKVDPWSVTRFSFVLSLVCFVVFFVAVAVLWVALDILGVFDAVAGLIRSLTVTGNGSGINAESWFAASRILGYAALIGAFSVVIFTALATLGAYIYNIVTDLVGGIEVTLREPD